MKNHALPRPIAAIVAGLAVVATATTVLAASPSPTASPGTRLEQVKAHAAQAVANREQELQKLAGQVSAAQDLTDHDRAQLAELISDDESGLNALNAKIQADTTLAAAVADAGQIVTAYRVYVLVVPKTHLVIAADTVSAVDTKLHAVADRLKDAIDHSRLHEDQKQAARAKLEDLNENVAAADRDVDGLSAMLLSLTPQGYPGNRTQLESARDRLHDARTHLAAARADARAIVALLKG